MHILFIVMYHSILLSLTATFLMYRLLNERRVNKHGSGGPCNLFDGFRVLISIK